MSLLQLRLSPMLKRYPKKLPFDLNISDNNDYSYLIYEVFNLILKIRLKYVMICLQCGRNQVIITGVKMNIKKKKKTKRKFFEIR